MGAQVKCRCAPSVKKIVASGHVGVRESLFSAMNATVDPYPGRAARGGNAAGRGAAGMRHGMAVLLAYAIFAHLIAASFSTAALAAGRVSTDSASGGMMTALLCTPGARQDQDAPGDGVQRRCCGLCLFSGGQAWAPAAAAPVIAAERTMSLIRWRFGRVSVADRPEIVPAARGPPLRMRPAA